MRNPDTLQEVVEEKVAAAGDEGFTLKLPRTVARSDLIIALFQNEFAQLSNAILSNLIITLFKVDLVVELHI